MKKTSIIVMAMALVMSGFLTPCCAAQASKDPCAGMSGVALAQCQDQQRKEKQALQKQQNAMKSRTAEDKERSRRFGEMIKKIK